jgi:hypothetical protein
MSRMSDIVCKQDTDKVLLVEGDNDVTTPKVLLQAGSIG